MEDNQSFEAPQNFLQRIGNHLNGFRLIPKTLLFVLLSGLYACDSNHPENQIQDVSFSTSTYYPSFLFIAEKNDTVTKTLKFHFNHWAIQQGSGAQIGLYDDQDKLIDADNDNLSAFINDLPATSGTIDINSQVD